MKRSLISFILSLFSFCLLGQQKLDTLIFQNGNIEIATISRIASDSVEYIFPNETLVNIANTKELASIHLASGRIVSYMDGRRISEPSKQLVETKINYPESYTIELGTNLITMILVEGGSFDMGYDDSHSLRMKSEPVHPVRLTPFYISKEYISKGVISFCNSTKNQQNSKPVLMKWNEAKSITESIAEFSGLPYRLPTEAEWECSAISNQKDVIFEKYKGSSLMELCLDYFGTYPSPEKGVLVDPVGPAQGKRHVIRCFSNDSFYLFNRSIDIDRGYFRIAIKAHDVFPAKQ